MDFENVRKQLAQKEEDERMKSFLKKMEGKTFNELTLNEMQYLYDNMHTMYTSMSKDRELKLIAMDYFASKKNKPKEEVKKSLEQLLEESYNDFLRSLDKADA